MIRVRTVLGVLGSAAVFGLLIALPLGRHRQVSVELWLAGLAAWTGLTLVLRALATAPLDEPRLRPLLWWRAEPADPPPPLPRALAALDGTLLAARDSDRAFAHRLQPRLRELADHRLRVDHGIDPDREPGRVAAVLGDVAWLVGRDRAPHPDPDQSAEGRTPTVEDIHRLLDRLEQPAREGARA